MKNKIIFCSTICALISLFADETIAQDGKAKRMVINTPLDASQGIGFEKYAPLKLIRETRTLSFVLNLTKIVEEEEAKGSEGIKRAKSFCEKMGNSCLHEMNNAEKILEIRIRELRDLTSRRKKRSFLDYVTTEDGKKLENSLVDVRQFALNLQSNLISQYDNITRILTAQNLSIGATRNLTEAHNIMTVNLTAIVMTSDIKFKIIRFEEQVKAIYRMFVNKRIDSDFITVDEFQKELDRVKSSLNSSDMSLPAWSIRDYYNNLEIRYSIEEGILTVEMDVPLVESSKYLLYKILKYPTRLNGRVVIMKTDWTYLGANKENVVTFLNLDICYREPGAYLCELQSPIHSVDSKHCLTNMISTMSVNSALCGKEEIQEIPIEQLKLTFIKRSESQYFFYSPNAESLSWFCDGTSHNLSFDVHSSGILSIPYGCYVDTGTDKLLATGRRDEPAFEKKDFISIHISIAEIDQMIQASKDSKVVHHQIISDEKEYDKLFEGSKSPAYIEMAPLPKGSEGMASVSLGLSIAMFAGVFVIYLKYIRKSNQKE